MNILRSIIFNIFLVVGSLFLSIVLLWSLALPADKCAVVVSTYYGGYIRWITRHIMGLRLELRGLENLPVDTPCILAAKHQSAYETLTIPFTQSFRLPVIILKKELTKIPLWGLYPGGMGQVAINRGEGLEAMRSMSAGCKAAIAAGRSIIIFPQGTRVKPGEIKPYKPGIAKIYRDLGVPIVPVALNTGVFWGRNAFFKKSGTIVYEFLPAIPAGQPPLKMMEQLEQLIESASDKLVIEAGGPALPVRTGG
ncbi:MAG: lysophospholipid acyltransferase family protein [Micavibrio sp.]|nr:lysophospholipid acyltransferase family protein [Micavibrio sp.]